MSVCELAEERGVLRGANDEQRGRGEGVRGFICSRWTRCRVLGTALWSQFSGVSAELGRMLCQRAEARVQ
jgi:hypothetical protein